MLTPWAVAWMNSMLVIVPSIQHWLRTRATVDLLIWNKPFFLHRVSKISLRKGRVGVFCAHPVMDQSPESASAWQDNSRRVLSRRCAHLLPRGLFFSADCRVLHAWRWPAVVFEGSWICEGRVTIDTFYKLFRQRVSLNRTRVEARVSGRKILFCVYGCNSVSEGGYNESSLQTLNVWLWLCVTSDCYSQSGRPTPPTISKTVCTLVGGRQNLASKKHGIWYARWHFPPIIIVIIITAVSLS